MSASTSSRLRIQRRRITFVFSAVSLLSIGVVLLFGPVPDVVQLTVVALLVTILGLPHGALDVELADALRLIRSGAAAAGFFAGYLLLAAGGIGLWLWWPMLALAIFLLISAYHFSDDWLAALGRPASLAFGTVVLGLPAISHPDIVARVFSWLLVPEDQAALLVTLLRFAAGFGLPLLAVALLRRPRSNWPLLLEIGVLAAGSIFLSPLLYFVLYFCLIHAQRHVLDCAEFLSLPVMLCYRKSVPILFLTLILAASSYSLFASGDFSEDMARWLFIGLFALTIPHMAVIAYWNRATGACRG